MAELSAQIASSLYWNHTDQDAAGRDSVDANSLAYTKTLTRGSGAGQADQVWHKRLIILSGNTYSINLSDGSIFDRHGSALVLARLKWLGIKSFWEGTSIRCNVGLESSPFAAWFALTGVYVPLLVDGFFELGSSGAEGYPVTAGEEDTITLEAVGGDVTVDIALLGASA